ncbi:L-lactate MFS transporter [Sporolactobacillus putidus]|uniref:MFS transporter n=1 Tax=Sporolactobacillus putidus TaxID=492735 RepID=A0A917S2K7_9BACL|nr:OFA family MFS transporter [Sporolactobacillus putidus]GGL50968.1 MFS transporter [Sporolactobacillus putidus]
MTTAGGTSKKTVRWPILAGTVIVMIGLGTIYTWSLFNQPLGDKFGWNVGAVATTFSIMSFALSLSTLSASKIQEKFGIRGLLILSAIGMGTGLALSSLASALWMLYIAAGILVGASNGIAYMTTLSNAIQWFPERKGLVSGIAIGAYGIGSVLFKYVLAFLIQTVGVFQTFFYWGVISFAMIGGGLLLIRKAPLIAAKKDSSRAAAPQHDFVVGEMLKTKQAYLLFFVLFTACMSGLYMIGSVANIGTSLARLDAATAANAVALVALFNTAGRLVLGALSDHCDRLKVVAAALLVTAAAAVTLSSAALSYPLFFICVSGVAFCFGGNITIFPTIVSEFFGLKNQSQNYGIVYQGFGLGGLSASFISGLLGGFVPTFRLIAFLCSIACIVALTLHAPGLETARAEHKWRRKQLQKLHVH